MLRKINYLTKTRIAILVIAAIILVIAVIFIVNLDRDILTTSQREELITQTKILDSTKLIEDFYKKYGKYPTSNNCIDTKVDEICIKDTDNISYEYKLTGDSFSLKVVNKNSRDGYSIDKISK